MQGVYNSRLDMYEGTEVELEGERGGEHTFACIFGGGGARVLILFLFFCLVPSSTQHFGQQEKNYRE